MTDIKQDELREALSKEIGFFKWQAKYFDYIEAPQGTLGGKYPYPMAIEELDREMDRVMKLINTEVTAVLDRLEKELPVNDNWKPESDEEVGMMLVRESMKGIITVEREKYS